MKCQYMLVSSREGGDDPRNALRRVAQRLRWVDRFWFRPLWDSSH